MALNFPTAPIDGAIHTFLGVEYTYSAATDTWNKSQYGTAATNEFNEIWAAGKQARMHFYRYGMGTAYTYHHIKTDIPWANHTQMYSIEFTGHEYGASFPINAQAVWYNYTPNAGVISFGTRGTHTIAVYQSTDGFTVIRIQYTSGYYAAWTLSQFTTNQGLRPITVTGVTATNATSAY